MIPTTDAALCITFPLLAILAVGARFWARRIRSTSILADDWLIVFALVCSVATGILGLLGAVYGAFGVKQPLGPEGFPQTNPQIVVYNEITYVSQIIGIGALCGSKLSILLFYKRVFTPYLARRLLFHVIVGVNAFWGFAYFMLYLLRCVPISDAWEIPNGRPRRCIPNNDAEYSYAITNVLLDAAILAMPIPMVWSLRLPTKQKIAVISIFLLGIIVTGIGIAKTVAFYNFGTLYKSNHQLTYDGTLLFYYTVPENCLQVVGACLPTLRPLFQGFSPESILGSIRSVISLPSRHSHTTNTTNHHDSKTHGDSSVSFAKISEEGSVKAAAVSVPSDKNWTEMEPLPDKRGASSDDVELGR